MMASLTMAGDVRAPQMALPQRPAGPPMDKMVDLDSPEHNKLVDWCNEMVDYATRGKRTIEKEGLEATRHYCSFLDPVKHQWPVKVYDPVLLGTVQGQLAGALEAIFAQPPIMDYLPFGPSDWDDARMMQAMVGWHLAEIEPRMTIHNGYQGQELVGTQVWHTYWDYQERYTADWRRVPVEMPDPRSGGMTWVDEGRWEWSEGLKIVRASPNLKDVHITQLFLDDTDEDIQKASFIGVRSVLTADEARERVHTDGWDQRAVERALEGDWSTRSSAAGKISEQIDWLKSIQLHVGAQEGGIFGSPRYGGDRSGGRRAVEVFELWRRVGPRIERIVLLNRMWIGLHRPSPYGTGRYPFHVSRCFGLQGQFWAVSGYRANKWLIQAIQTLRNAGVSEAALAAMPPMLLATGVTILGKRWEPRAEWHLEGAGNQPLGNLVQFLEKSGASVAVAHQQADNLIARFDSGMGSSETARGAANSLVQRQTATVANLAAGSAGRRDKLKIDNFGETLKGVAQDFADYVRQFQDYDVQVQLRPGSKPLTVRRDYLRSVCVKSKETIASAGLRELRERRVEILYKATMTGPQGPNPYINPEAMLRLYVQTVAPEEADVVVKSTEQVQAEQQQAMMQQQAMAGGGPGGQPGGPAPAPDPTAEMAAELKDAYATA